MNAETDYEKSIALDGSNPKAYYNYATLRFLQLDYDAAIKFFTKSIDQKKLCVKLFSSVRILKSASEWSFCPQQSRSTCTSLTVVSWLCKKIARSRMAAAGRQCGILQADAQRYGENPFLYSENSLQYYHAPYNEKFSLF